MFAREYAIYIMASRSRTLYIGFTANLMQRVWQHKNDVHDGFSKQYGCHRLVHFERFSSPEAGIAREKQLKRWSRAKKLALLLRENPAWADLSEDWGKPIVFAEADTAGLFTPVERTHRR